MPLNSTVVVIVISYIQRIRRVNDCIKLCKCKQQEISNHIRTSTKFHSEVKKKRVRLNHLYIKISLMKQIKYNKKKITSKRFTKVKAALLGTKRRGLLTTFAVADKIALLAAITKQPSKFIT